MTAWLLAAMLLLAPKHDRAELVRLAVAIDAAVAKLGTLFTGTEGPRKSAALMTAVAYRESSFRVAAKGRGSDCGAWQHVTHDKAECDRLRSDAAYAAEVAHRDLKRSIAACPGEPLGVYAMGKCGTKHGAWVSRDRMQIARKLMTVKEVE